MTQLTTEAISAAFQVIATSFSPHDGENTMRFERASQSLAKSRLATILWSWNDCVYVLSIGQRGGGGSQFDFS